MNTIDNKKAFINIQYNKNFDIEIKTNIVQLGTNNDVFYNIFIIFDFDEKNAQRYITMVDDKKTYLTQIENTIKFFTVKIIKDNVVFEKVFKNLNILLPSA